MPTLNDLPTDHLVPHERNIRSGVGDLSDMQASIRAVGILQPLLVVPLPADHPCTATLDVSDETPWYQIVIGHRRHAAASALGLEQVPCLVATDEGEADRVVKMLAENVHRQGLSASEEAEAYRQLALLDWTPEQISTVTAKPASRVRDALTLVTLPEQVRAAADQGELDLADAALLTEFAQDPKVLDRLLTKGRGWGLSHAVAEERAKRERRDTVERLKAELVLAGVKVTPRPAGFGYDSREVAAHTLLDVDGTPLDPERVQTLAGFAAFVDASSGTPTTLVYCIDPERHGYTRTRSTSYVTPEAAQARAREEAERAAEDQGLQIAAGVRREFLAATYAHAKGAKTLHLQALRDAMSDPESISVEESMLPLVKRLAGCDLATIPTAGADRLSRVLVARWLATAETHVERLATRRTWNCDPRIVTAHLQRLTAAGYQLSDAEQHLHTRARDLTTRTTPTATTGPDTQDPSDTQEPDDAGEGRGMDGDEPQDGADTGTALSDTADDDEPGRDEDPTPTPDAQRPDDPEPLQTSGQGESGR